MLLVKESPQSVHERVDAMQKENRRQSPHTRRSTSANSSSADQNRPGGPMAWLAAPLNVAGAVVACGWPSEICDTGTPVAVQGCTCGWPSEIWVITTHSVIEEDTMMLLVMTEFGGGDEAVVDGLEVLVGGGNGVWTLDDDDLDGETTGGVVVDVDLIGVEVVLLGLGVGLVIFDFDVEVEVLLVVVFEDEVEIVCVVDEDVTRGIVDLGLLEKGEPDCPGWDTKATLLQYVWTNPMASRTVAASMGAPAYFALQLLHLAS